MSKDLGEAPVYPVIDIDPHFRRVVQNFRQSDYLVWGASTAGFPGALYLMELADPTRKPKVGGISGMLRLGTALGACGGFLMAYQLSSFRFWGWTENGREAARAEREGDSAPGLDVSKSSLDPYMQGVLPWFNLVNHPYHKPPEEQAK